MSTGRRGLTRSRRPSGGLKQTRLVLAVARLALILAVVAASLSA